MLIDGRARVRLWVKVVPALERPRESPAAAGVRVSHGAARGAAAGVRPAPSRISRNQRHCGSAHARFRTH